jgi:hypothetical protein
LSGVGGAEQKEVMVPDIVQVDGPITFSEIERVQQVVVVSDIVQVWPVPITEPGQEMKIVLPEPATLAVHYDIPGDLEQAQLWLEFRSGIIADLTEPLVANGGEIVLTNLAPGTYDFARNKRLMIGRDFNGTFCDRATLELKCGQVQNVDWVRATGFPVAGEITGYKDAGFSSAFIQARPAGVTGAFMDMAEEQLPYYDLVACGPDGRFQTARLSPGTYTLVAEAYRPIPPEEERGMHERKTRTRMAEPVGTAQVTVSADAAPAPVSITLRPPKQ